MAGEPVDVPLRRDPHLRRYGRGGRGRGGGGDDRGGHGRGGHRRRRVPAPLDVGLDADVTEVVGEDLDLLPALLVHVVPLPGPLGVLQVALDGLAVGVVVADGVLHEDAAVEARQPGAVERFEEARPRLGDGGGRRAADEGEARAYPTLTFPASATTAGCERSKRVQPPSN